MLIPPSSPSRGVLSMDISFRYLLNQFHLLTIISGFNEIGEHYVYGVYIYAVYQL